MAPTAVAVIDRTPVLSEALCEKLAEVSDLRAVAADSYIDRFGEFCAAQRPDVVVLHEAHAHAHGDKLLKELEGVPGPPALVLLTNRQDPADTAAALQDGASGVVLKIAPELELANAVRCASRGEIWISSPLLAPILTGDGVRAQVPATDKLNDLSPTERHVLELIGDGLDRGAIAARLGISRRAVVNHMQHLRWRLGLHSDSSVRDAVRGTGTQA
ncbi:MAG TPA: response regulator transcription factor [Acidimicrobiales bacterium]|jgi:DNA-binding NarL/FixJ family response regulator